MNKEKLQAMVQFLKELPRDKFEYSSFTLPEAFKEQDGVIQYDCGTAGCAVGWMPAMFPDDFAWTKTYDFIHVMNKESGEINMGAAAEYFELTDVETDYLFDPGVNGMSNASPGDVADLIEEVMDEGFPYHIYEDDYY